MTLFSRRGQQMRRSLGSISSEGSFMGIDEASWSVADQDAGYALPPRFFYDGAVFEQEKAKIFFKSWHLVAHVNELREPGTFVTHQIFEQSVIVVAGRDGEIGAFHNVCQHGGNRLSRRGAARDRCGTAATM